MDKTKYSRHQLILSSQAGHIKPAKHQGRRSPNPDRLSLRSVHSLESGASKGTFLVICHKIAIERCLSSALAPDT